MLGREITPSGPYMTKKKNNIEKELQIEWNKKAHQMGNTECGVYAMHFIISMLNGTTFSEFCRNGHSDAEMNKFRAKYFRM